MTEPLGVREWQAGWRVQRVPRSAFDVLKLAHEIILLVGMTPDGEAHIKAYPTQDGKGGEGIQLYQPLVESWLVIGTWPEHGFMRVNLSSCKPFEPGIVSSFLSLLGQVDKEFEAEL